jgi:hypothetical protein
MRTDHPFGVSTDFISIAGEAILRTGKISHARVMLKRIADHASDQARERSSMRK